MMSLRLSHKLRNKIKAGDNSDMYPLYWTNQ